MYNYEWREKDFIPHKDHYEGLHNHIMIAVSRNLQNPRAPAHIRKKLSRINKFKVSLPKMCDVKNKRILNIKTISGHEVQRKINYFRGFKTDKKMNYVSVDKKIRRYKQLQDYYCRDMIL